MNNDKDQTNIPDNGNNEGTTQPADDKNAPTINPLTGKESNITQQDIDNEQKFKEALTERD